MIKHFYEVRRGSPTGSRVWRGSAENWLHAIDKARKEGVQVNLGNTAAADYVVHADMWIEPRDTLRMVNLTPHMVIIAASCGDHELPPTGCARRSEVAEACGYVLPYHSHVSSSRVPIEQRAYGDVVGLPEPAPDTIYIVSQMVAEAVPHRGDVFFPTRVQRYADGRPTRCLALGSVYVGQAAITPYPRLGVE